MGEKGLYYPVVRRAITIISLLLIISGFLAVYYLVYLPQEHAYYNLRTFRVLHEITQNFQQRVENYGTVYSNTYISQKYKDKALRTLPQLNDSGSRNNFDSSFRLSFTGDVKRNNSFRSTKIIKQDSVFYTVDKIDTSYKKSEHKNDTAKKETTDTCVFKQGRSLSDILQPLISIHADVFESVLLIKQTADGKDNPYDAILYESEKSDIANINADSLFKNRSIESPRITDLDIEDISYKMFLLPFKMHGESQTYILAGIVPYDVYREQSQNIPVSLLLSVCFILIFLLIALPFLKIFFLSAEENIKINDVRAIIAVIFVIPFFVTLIIAGTLISMDSDKFTNKTLASLQYNVQKNFYIELKDAVHQAKHYDSVMKAPSAFITDSGNIGKIIIDSFTLQKINKYDSLVNANNIDSSDKDNHSHRDSLDLKDIILYPQYYKNITSLHWMDANGNDIAAWNFNKLPASYFSVADRQYFRDIRYNKACILKDSLAGNKDNIDTFSVLPVLSRLTGEYIFNIATPSNTKISKDKKAIAVGVSSKMYSVYNTIVPSGFAFCIIDEKGLIVCHSDTARSLQENIFEECSDSFALRSIVNHKDVALRDLNLYEQPVKMLIKPLPGLPYYLVTYYNKRGGYLYIFHILAFVFICEAALLFFVSLFSYFMMLSDKKNSKLFFTQSTLSWLKPSPDKKNYYIKNSIQFIACLFFVAIIGLLFTGNTEDYYLYTLNAGLLLPLFAVTSYYITKSARAFFQTEKPGLQFTKAQYVRFLGSMPNILILYFVSIIIFILLQSVLFFNVHCKPHVALEAAILILVILMPFMVSFIAGMHSNKKTKENLKLETTSVTKDTGYLFHFILSLLLGVTLTSIIPSMIFISYAFREEKTYQLQAFQIDLAKKIQQRRTDVNPRLWQTKLNIFPLNDTPNVFSNASNNFINELKFEKSKGIYLLRNDSIKQLDSYNAPVQRKINCSPFYKKTTQYLFLPPDHDEFYDGLTNEDYYYWQNSSNKKNDSDALTLTYNNYTDNRKPPAFSLTVAYPHPQLFKEFTTTYISLIILLVLFMLVFYKIIYSVSVRVFLIDFFEEINGNPGDKPDKELQKQSYAEPNLIKTISEILGTGNVNFKTIREIENEKITDKNDADGFILELHFALMNVYENLWNTCTDIQKYTLYDFATDGFTNYKKVITLHQLYKAGLIIKEPDGNVTLVTKSFRNFLITKETSVEIKKLGKQGKRGSWGSLRTVFYIVLIAVAIFIFLSQEEASKRLITIVTSLGALLPAMLKLFDKSSLPAPSSAKNTE